MGFLRMTKVNDIICLHYSDYIRSDRNAIVLDEVKQRSSSLYEFATYAGHDDSAESLRSQRNCKCNAKDFLFIKSTMIQQSLTDWDEWTNEKRTKKENLVEQLLLRRQHTNPIWMRNVVNATTKLTSNNEKKKIQINLRCCWTFKNFE